MEFLEVRRMLCDLGVDYSGPHSGHDAVAEIAAASRSPLVDVPLVGPAVRDPELDVARANAQAETLDDEIAATPAVTGGLTGKVAYLNAGHGWTYNGSSWATQRPKYQEIVEDFETQDKTTYYADYLLHAGATVSSIRPLGHQTTEIIVDNNDAAFTIQSGSWSTNTASSTYWSNTNGADTANRYRFASTAAAESAVARWTPTIGTAGFYPVYAWWNNGSNRSMAATYRINSGGGSQEVSVNQRYTGKGWVYLGNYYFDAGTGGNVELSNKGAAGDVVIADAIRFGNGMGTWAGDGTGPVSGRSKEEELSLYWAYLSRGWTASGTRVAQSTVDGGVADDGNAGINAPPRWFTYMNDESQGVHTDRIFLSIHSNGSTGLPNATARGTEALVHSTNPTPNNAWFANALGNEVEEDLQALPAGYLETSWASRGNTFAGSYGEMNNSIVNNEYAATMLETGFHDNLEDSELLRDPNATDWVARASYQTTAKYFNTFGGTTATLLPDPPTNIRTTTNAANGNVVLNWSAPGTGAANGGAGAATGYRVYTSSNGYAWSDVVTLGNVLTTTFTGLSTTAMTYFKVVAINAGGESIQHDVVAGKPQAGSRAAILIVNGYDRNGRIGDDTVSYSSGTTARVRYRYNNSRDYAIQYAEAIEAFNNQLGVETAQNEQVISGTVNLANYHTVLWISGEEMDTVEGNSDASFTATEQTLITNYVNTTGGKFLANGAELGIDLDANGQGVSFYNNVLHANYASNDAGSTYSGVTGVASSAFNGVTSVTFDNGANEGMDSRTYDVDTPDVIAAINGSTNALTYSGGAIAAVQWASGTNTAKVITMGFPFETITTASKRNSVMGGILTYFGTTSTLSPPSATPGTPNLVAGTDSGQLDTDNRTNFNNSTALKAPQFTVGSTISGATIRIYFTLGAGTPVLIGSAVASGTTTTVTGDGVTSLAFGTYNVTATQEEPSKDESVASAALSVIIDAGGPASPTSMIVTGITPSSISTDWNSSTAPDLWGYNIYRSDTTGGPYTKLNPTPLANSDYTDTTVISGQTYYYVAAGIDTAGNEANPVGPEVSATAVSVSATPGAPDLIAAYDSGSLNTDDITKLDNSSGANQLQFSVGSTVSGATVNIYSDGTLIGSAVATGATTVVTTDGATDILDGPHNITATQIEPSLTESASSSALSVTVDTTAPTVDIIDVSPDPRDSSVSSIAVNFSEDVDGVDLADLALTRNGGSNLLTAETFNSGNGSDYLLQGLDPITAASGNYDLVLTAAGSSIADLAGNALAAGASDAFAVNVINGDAINDDVIRIEPAGANTVDIFVNNNTAIPDYTWTFSPGEDLIVNTGGGDDKLVITAPIDANVVYDGGAQGANGDSLEVIGDGVVTGSYAPGALTGDGTVTIGAYDVEFTGLEPVSVSNFASFSLVTPGAADVINIDSPSAGVNRITGTSGGVAFESLSIEDVASFTLDTGAGSSDTVTIDTSGLVGATGFTFAGGDGSDTLNVNGGTLEFDADAATTTDELTLNVGAGALVNFNASQHLKALNLSSGLATLVAGGAKVIVTDTLTATAGGTLDLTDNDLIVKLTPIGDVTALVTSGFGNFDWLGTGITSSTAAAFAQVDGSRAVGVIDNVDWGYGEFSGETVNGSDVLVKFTYTGDANVDGLVDNDDFGQFLYGFNGGGSPKWINGDFDFSGVVDNDDFGSLNTGMNAFNAGGNVQL